MYGPCFVISLSPSCIPIVSMERVVEDEWLDEDRGTPDEIGAALHSITLANRRFGGVRLHARLIRRALTHASRQHRPHILEVASGRADVLKAALLELDLAPDVTLLDRSAAHLPDPVRGRQSYPRRA